VRVSVPFPDGERAAVLERVQSPDRWPTHVPGLREVVGRAPRLTLYFGGPRPFRCVIQATIDDDGVAFTLEEGAPRVFEGDIRVGERTLEVDVTLDVGRSMPGMLHTTLESDVVQRFAVALSSVRASRAGTDRSGD
jgi:hypothetical protein